MPGKRKKGEAAEASPLLSSSVRLGAVHRSSGALASHGLTPQYSRRDGA